MTPERIAEIEARLAKATPSTVMFLPWGESDAYSDTVHFFIRSDTDIRDLLAEVRRQKERIEKLEVALEFYAGVEYMQYCGDNICDVDDGETAKKALEG